MIFIMSAGACDADNALVLPMQINPATMSIGELAVEYPTALPVFDQLGVDYSCRGAESIADACERAGITVEELSDAILGAIETPPARDWNRESLAAIQGHIVTTHHRFTRQALETVSMLAEKVANRHGATHPEVLRVRELVDALRRELLPHMLREELDLFPRIADLEAAAAAGVRPAIDGPLLSLKAEHDTASGHLAELRALTREYELPPDACLSFRALYERLAELEDDLETHLRLEHDLLFPRASALEEERRSA